MRNDKENIILEKTFALALDIITYAEQIRNMKRYEMSSQIFRCGTSIGANVREAQNAESKSDFIHKFKIAAKEADELQYWLELCTLSNDYPSPPDAIQENLNNIHLIISKIISTSKKP